MRHIKKGQIIISQLLPLLCLFLSCSNDIFEDGEELYSEGLKAMNARAKDMSSFCWSPLSNIHIGNANYTTDCNYWGIPYSSVKELDTNVGIEVSFYTYATAIGNPRSVIYTENITEEPYHGTNCSLYYGTVCSTTVEYVLGIDIPYATNMIDTLSCFAKKKYGIPDSTAVGDILLSKGHVVIVTNVKRNNDGNPTNVQILESAGVGLQAKLNDYTYSSFNSRWNKIGWVPYVFNGIDNVTPNEGIPTSVIYKNVCPNKGDKSCYRNKENVTINVLSENGSYLQLYRNDMVVEKRDIKDTRDIIFSDLSEGYYTVRLLDNNQNMIDTCNFAVFNCDISIEKLEDDQIKVVFPQTRYTPHYVTLVDIYGNRYAIDVIDDKDRTVGYKIVTVPKDAVYGYCKVVLKNEYGQIANYPIKIN